MYPMYHIMFADTGFEFAEEEWQNAPIRALAPVRRIPSVAKRSIAAARARQCKPQIGGLVLQQGEARVPARRGAKRRLIECGSKTQAKMMLQQLRQQVDSDDDD